MSIWYQEEGLRNLQEQPQKKNDTSSLFFKWVCSNFVRLFKRHSFQTTRVSDRTYTFFNLKCDRTHFLSQTHVFRLTECRSLTESRWSSNRNLSLNCHCADRRLLKHLPNLHFNRIVIVHQPNRCMCSFSYVLLQQKSSYSDIFFLVRACNWLIFQCRSDLLMSCLCVIAESKVCSKNKKLEDQVESTSLVLHFVLREKVVKMKTRYVG